MNRILSLSAFAFFFLSATAWAATTSEQVNSSMVLIANYSDDGDFLGWGSGFFVDEGIVVTNKHVIEGGDWHRVYATDASDSVDFGCKKDITKSDVKINLNDDVAYMRVYLQCEHGVIPFAGEDPAYGLPISVVGYRYLGSIEDSLKLTTTTGSVRATTPDGWVETDAVLDVGNSGGPVVDGAHVVGVAVAKGVGAHGEYVTGYFIPASVIEDGLIYANDPRFGYTPQSRASSSRSSSSSSSTSISSRTSSSSSSVSSRRISSSQRSSARTSADYRVSRQFEARTCERVLKWFRYDAKMMGRINVRLIKRFGFTCG